MVKFEIKKDFNDKGILEEQCENYSCKARIEKDHELSSDNELQSRSTISFGGRESSVFARIGGRKFLK